MATVINTRDVAILGTVPRTTTATGFNAVTLILLSPVSVVNATNAGVVSTLPTGNFLRLYIAGALQTTNVTYGPATTTKNGLTAAVNSSTGEITLSQSTWSATDSEFFDLTGTYNSVTYTARYTVTKAKSGVDGAGSNAISAVLTNESSVVATDSNGDNGNFSGASTTLKIYNGDAEDTGNWTFSVTKTNVTTTEATTSNTQTVTALSQNVGYIDFVASRSGFSNINKRYVISKARSGVPGTSPTSYWLVVSAAAIAKSTTNVFSPASLTVTGMSAAGVSSPGPYPGRFKIYENGSGSPTYTSSSNEVNTTYTPSSTGVSSIKVELYLAGGTTTLLDEQTIPVVVDGTSGVKTTTVRLYQWNLTSPAVSPSGTAQLTWSSLTQNTYTGGGGWSFSVPANPGTSGLRLYVAEKSISDVATATVTTVDWSTGFSVSALSENGQAGANGARYAVARIFRWSAAPAPSAVGAVTYTWATGALSFVPSGWSLTAGISPSPGFNLYEASYRLIDAATVLQTTFDWTQASISIVGYAGFDGGVGPQGAMSRVAYAKSTNFQLNQTPVDFTTSSNNTFPIAGTYGSETAWGATVPVPSVGEYIHQLNGIYNPVTTQTVWGLPYLATFRVGQLSALTVNTGALTVNQNLTVTSGAILGGAFTSFAWPAGIGEGFYLSNEGLKLGNPSTGRYFQVNTNGNIYTPGFQVVNGVATFNGINIVSGALQGIGTGNGTPIANSLLDGPIANAGTTANWLLVNNRPTIFDSFFERLDSWTYVTGADGKSLVTSAGSSGGTVMRVEGYHTLLSTELMPVSTDRIYLSRCRARKVSGTGGFYAGFACYDAAGNYIAPIPAGGTYNYSAFSGAELSTNWQANSAYIDRPVAADDGALHFRIGTAFVRLMALCNYGGSGVTEIDALEFFDATDAYNSAKTADWNQVTGTGRPSDYATVSSADAATALGFNPQFSAWGSTTYPDGWYNWTGSAPVKETTFVRTGPFAVSFTVSGTNTGMYRDVYFNNTPTPSNTFVTGSFDAYVANNAGGSGKPGILVRLFYGTGGSDIRDTLVEVPRNDVGGWQRVPFSARVQPGEKIYGIAVYLMAAWEGFTSGSWSVGSRVIYDNLSFDFKDSTTDALALVPSITTAGTTANYTGVSGLPANISAAGLNPTISLLNSNVTITADGRLQGGGGGQVTQQPILDNRRTANNAPSYYAANLTSQSTRTLEFKASSWLTNTENNSNINDTGISPVGSGSPPGANYWVTLETVAQFGQGTGAGQMVQYCYSGVYTYRRFSSDTIGSFWGTWARDLDTNLYTGDLNATFGATSAQAAELANKLNRAGADTITGPIGFTSSTALLVGNTTTGVYIGTTGIVGRSGGDTTFSLSNTGTLLVKGDISGSNGNFVGSMSVNGATWGNSALGFFAGIDGGHARMRIGSPSQYLKYDSSTGLLELKLDQFLVATSPTNISLFPTGSGYVTVGTGNITCSVTAAGVTPYSYSWSVEYWSGGDGSTNVYIVSSSNTCYAVIQNQPDGSTVSGSIKCIVVDANGRVASASTYFSSVYGIQP